MARPRRTLAGIFSAHQRHGDPAAAAPDRNDPGLIGLTRSESVSNIGDYSKQGGLILAIVRWGYPATSAGRSVTA